MARHIKPYIDQLIRTGTQQVKLLREWDRRLKKLGLKIRNEKARLFPFKKRPGAA